MTWLTCYCIPPCFEPCRFWPRFPGKLGAGQTLLSVIILLAAGLCIEPVYGETINSAGSGFWDAPATWSPARLPANTDDVTIASSHIVTNQDVVTRYAANLTIQGILTHKANAGSEAYKVILQIVSNLTIDAGGSINVDSMGYSAGSGPGYGSQTGGNSGGSYGGNGGASSASQNISPTYGSITAPTNLGSGGRTLGGSQASGGGAILLIVSGTTTVNGVISAVGGTNNTTVSAGSGGTVFLTTGTLTGDGTIRANGGTPSGSSSGGGGRVAVILTNSTDFSNVKMQAYGGSMASCGAAGTVYLEHTGHTRDHGKLIVDWNNFSPNDRVVIGTLQNGKAASTYAFAEIVLTNGAVYTLDTNDTLDITGTTIRGDPINDINRYNGIYVAGGTLTVPAAFAFSNYFIGIGATNATFNPTTSLTVGTNATLKVNLLDVPYTLNCPVTVQPGGLLNHSANGYKLNLAIGGNLDIQTGAQANVDGLGYSAANGPGAPSSTASGTAASYGGLGGCNPAAFNLGTTYGSITAPTNLGSGGRSLGSDQASGGGAIRLNVSGTTTVNGVISALGGTNCGQSAGSGGSVFLTTGTLTGNGTIRADGGTTPQSGGGGRVAVILTNSTDFSNVKMQAYGGSTDYKGAAGTVYFETQAQGPGQGKLLIDASNTVSATPSTTLISSNVTGCVVGSVVITNAAIFRIDTNQSLTVNRSWTNNATFVANSNSTVFLASTNGATVAGSNAFWNLTCTTAVKTVFFTAGTTNRVSGQLTLGVGVTLKSTADGTWWYLMLATNGGAQQVTGVRVQDSNADNGQTIIVIPNYGSINMGHNVNWTFPPAGTIFMIR